MLRPLLALISAMAILSAADDGVYSLLNGQPGHPILLPVTRGHLWSMSNDNTRWDLFVEYPEQHPAGDALVVRLGGQVLGIGSWGSGQGVRSFSLRLDRALVPSAQAVFGFAPLARLHPGHRVDCAFTPERATYAPGDAVRVRFTLRNVGNAALHLRIGGANRGPRDDQYWFTASRDGETVAVKPAMNFGGLSNVRAIAPGEAYEATVRLGAWIDHAGVGSYEVRGGFHAELYADPEDDYACWEDEFTRTFAFAVKHEK